MKKISFAILAVAVLFASCDKKTTTPPTTTTTQPTPSPTPASGDGFLVAVKTVTRSTVGGFPVDVSIGTGVAGFGNLAAGTYNDAGAITLNTKGLTKNANNTYTYIPSATDPMGVDFSSDIDWSVGGGNGIPAFTHDASAQGMPNASEISGSYTTVNAASDFTVSTTGSVTNSDSVYFQIAGPNGYVLKRMASNTSSVTFTAAELATLGKGSGSIVVAPWNMGTTVQGGKTIYVINELALSRVVEIQ